MDWKPKYPIVDYAAIARLKGKVVSNYPRTERTCSICKSDFIRGEFPEGAVKSEDDLIGKDVCRSCGKKYNINGAKIELMKLELKEILFDQNRKRLEFKDLV